MKKQLLFIVSIGLIAGSIFDCTARDGGGGGGFHGGGGHFGGGHAGARAGGGHAAGARRSGGAHHGAAAHHGGSHAHAGHGGHGGHNHQHNRGWNHAHGYGWGWRNGGWGRGWGWGYWGWPFWWGMWYPMMFLYVGGAAAWNVANQTPDTIVVTSDDTDYTIKAGDEKLIPKSASGQMHIKARYNNTGGTYTTDNTYVVAGDKGGKLVMDSDPGSQQEENDDDPDYNADDEML